MLSDGSITAVVYVYWHVSVTPVYLFTFTIVFVQRTPMQFCPVQKVSVFASSQNNVSIMLCFLSPRQRLPSLRTSRNASEFGGKQAVRQSTDRWVALMRSPRRVSAACLDSSRSCSGCEEPESNSGMQSRTANNTAYVWVLGLMTKNDVR